MNQRILSPAVAVLLGCVSLHGQSPLEAVRGPSVDDRLAVLKALKIDAGTMALLEHSDAPTMTAPDGKALGNLPPRTIVKLVLNPAKGSNINVEIWLPDAGKWNGRFLGLGNGGSAGHINPGSLAGPLAEGSAVATTNMGTAPNADSGVGNREVWKDFGFRATHLMTLSAKQIVTAYYGKAPEFSYFSGGSTGGQQALQEAQRYPEDYDGIVAAIPAHCRTPLHAYFLWNDQILKKCPFTPTQEASVIAAANDYFAGREAPAVAGKFISDPRCNAKDIAAVIALALQKDPTLTPEHAAALRKLFGGPRHAVTGERIFNGIPLGSSLSAAHGHLYLFKWVFGANKKLEDINFGADIDTYTAALGPYLNAENADLSAFEKRGGRLIMTSGTADSVVPYTATLDYYEQVIEHFGSLEKVRSFFRYYLIPGMAHGGGPGLNQPPNTLEAVRTWREKGTVPEMLPGRRVVDGKKELEIPLFPYPTKTAWDAATSTFHPADGPRGGVERVAPSFRPTTAE
ncbi:MAG: tannase/feruloyl esterase family alpha/beta hydrolase [Chthoniobacter sp.]|uniref:tannase/feruloyl esterase family alpha/beta hydrolase n=1 Tax=Chthoniobacter sp. TaxID=2510640 RepID=UPI0032ADB7ED